jgi:hypothetical protein
VTPGAIGRYWAQPTQVRVSASCQQEQISVNKLQNNCINACLLTILELIEDPSKISRFVQLGGLVCFLVGNI